MNSPTRPRKGYRQLIAEAEAEIEVLDPAGLQALLKDPDTLVVDVRELSELRREGVIPGAFHAPRAFLEFWADPDGDYHKPELSSGRHLVLYCAVGMRSALAAHALHRMGFDRVGHLRGGFRGWVAAGGPVGAVPP